MNSKLKEFEHAGRAMGTEYSVSVVCESKELAQEMFALADADISAFESRFSRFLPDSELSKLNKTKGLIVSKTFLEAIEKAYELFVETRGIFNPLVQIERLGYDKSFNDPDFGKNFVKNFGGENSEIDTSDEPYDIDFSTVFIDKENSWIQLQIGQKLDFGGFLKGYLAEKIAKKIKSHSAGIVGVIVNLGGDIHTRGFDENGKMFVFDIHNPIDENRSVQIPLHDTSLATSGIYKRAWLHSSRGKIHHILDSSGKQNPTSDIVSASVIHEDGAQAEAYTKVFLSMDSKSSINLLANKHISFVTTDVNGQVIKNIS